MRMLLTGANGQIGVRCLHHWLAAGAQVVAITRKQNVFTHPNLTWVNADLNDPASLNNVGEPFPTTVVSTAFIWFLPPLMERLAARGVTRVIAFSSTSVHTKKDSAKTIEREMIGQMATSEEQLFAAGRAHNIAVTILRPTLVYGIGADKNITSIARIMKRFPIFPVPLNASGLRQPVHADDLAAATLHVATIPATYGKAYDVGGGERLTYRQFLSRIAIALHARVLLLPIPGFAMLLDIAGKLLRKPGRIHGEIARRMQHDMVFDDSAARADFNWQPRNFLDASRQPAGIAFF